MTMAPAEEEREPAALAQQVLATPIAVDEGSYVSGVDGFDEEDCYDSVCAICDNGGSVLLCDGKCMRSFHATVEDGSYSGCVSLGFTDAELQALQDVAFYCENCKYKKHQCFACGELGSSDELSSPEVFRCLNGTCGYFYHPHCVAKLLHPRNTAAEELKQRIAAGEQFTCPAHKCHDCKEVEVRSIKELQFAVCRRCPRAYHRKCLPREITSADDVNMERGILQRAWEDLIPNRILIYCLDHEIEPVTLMPIRNHLKFPGGKKKKLPLESEEIGLASEDNSGNMITEKPSKGADKLYCSSEKGDLSKTRMGKFSVQASSKKQKVASDGNSLGKMKQFKTCARDISLGEKLYATFFGRDYKLDESSSRGVVHGKNEMNQMVKPTAKRIDNPVTLDAAARRRILGLMKAASSSVTLSQVKERLASPSTHVQSIFPVENITLGKVEGLVQALRAALKILNEGGCVQDAKAVCGDALLLQVLRWKGKLKVYLAPFLYGMRYTSFGRHFTKMDKLKEIVDILHWYVQDGDMLVDFCCGSNDFSCLMKKKLVEMGKSCLFKNYDILQPKNDFSFERRDWMKVKPEELLDGSKLIMGLNPPFGVNAALANKFISKALEFKPKLLILIVPRETQRLDEMESPYDLIWEDDRMLFGKSFYLPGSVDVNDNQIEDWNVNAPLLSLWSSPNWTPTHRSIAKQHGHPSKDYSLDENHNVTNLPNSGPDEAFIEQDVDMDLDTPENLEQLSHSELTIIHQEGLPLDANGSEGCTKNPPVKNHSDLKSKEFSRKAKMNRSLVLSQRGDFQQQFNQMNSSMHPPYSHISYNGNHGIDDFIMTYSLNSKEYYQDFGQRSYIEEINDDHHRDATFQSDVNVHAREEPNSWSQIYAYPSYPPPSYGQLNISAMQQYGPPHFDELNHATMSGMVSVQNRSATYQPFTPRPAFQGSLGFVPRPYHSYSPRNSSGWLNE